MSFGAVFDMDGLMFDTERIVYEIWLEMLTADGLKYDLEIFKRTIGLRRDESEMVYKSVYGKDFDYDGYKQKSRMLHRKHIENNAVPIKSGLVELLDFLKNNDLKISLATSTSNDTALWMIEKSGLYDYFDAFVCGNEVKNGKPAPDVFLEAAKRIGVNPKNCFAFEDSFNGIRSAHCAGMITVMVPDLIEPDSEMKELSDFICSSLDESIEFIKKFSYNFN